jgi:small subunit ribosomal protein S5
MTDEKEKEIIEKTGEETKETETEKLEINKGIPQTSPGFGARGGRERRKNERRPSRRPERVRQEFDNKILSVRRVTRVVAGGRRFSFSIAMVVGDKKGRVGVGTGKAGDTPIAVEKAMQDAKKNLITIPLNKKYSINHPVEAKYSSARVIIIPAPGKGVVSGSAVRVVLELAGVKEVTSKILSRSKNKLNIARAAVKALKRLKVEKK